MRHSPGGDRAGHAAGHLRVPDHDLRAHRHGSRQRLHVRRLNRRSRSRDDGRPHHRPRPRRRRPHRASRVPRSHRHLRQHQGFPTKSPTRNRPRRLAALDAAITATPPASSSSRPTSSAPSKTSPPSPKSSTPRAHCCRRHRQSGLARHRWPPRRPTSSPWKRSPSALPSATAAPTAA